MTSASRLNEVQDEPEIEWQERFSAEQWKFKKNNSEILDLKNTSCDEEIIGWD